MSESKTKSTAQRRQALKKILAGTGAAGVVASAPEKWAKPVVNSITLPSHAMTSLPLSYFTPDFSVLAPDGGLQELLIPSAHAGGIPSIRGGSLCVNFNADMTTYTALFVFENSFHQKKITNGSINVATELSTVCGDETNLWLTIESGPNASGIPYTLCTAEISDDCESGILPPGECSTSDTCD